MKFNLFKIIQNRFKRITSYMSPFKYAFPFKCLEHLLLRVCAFKVSKIDVCFATIIANTLSKYPVETQITLYSYLLTVAEPSAYNIDSSIARPQTVVSICV